MKMISCRRRTQ